MKLEEKVKRVANLRAGLELAELDLRLAGIVELSFSSDSLEHLFNAKGAIPGKDWRFDYELRKDKVQLDIYHAGDRIWIRFDKKEGQDLPVVRDIGVNDNLLSPELRRVGKNLDRSTRDLREKIHDLRSSVQDLGEGEDDLETPRQVEHKARPKTAQFDSDADETERKEFFAYQALQRVETYLRAVAQEFFVISSKYFAGGYQPECVGENLALRTPLEILATIDLTSKAEPLK